ncbi:MAG: hypothetical protein FWG45_05100 [Oscillospiraceae bacterium]|nr:hypothetical protein [Oscillospiraceae bacterium]
MTKQEFDSCTRGIANSTIKLERGIITQEQHILDMKCLLGEQTFIEVQQIIDKNKGVS